MIMYKNEYRVYIAEQGVGKNDEVASSIDSYISYLNGLSRLLGQDITPNTAKNYDDINEMITELNGLKADSTLSKYKTAMKHYIDFIAQRNS